MDKNKQKLLINMQLGNIKNGANSRQRNRNNTYEIYKGISEIVANWKISDMNVAANTLCTRKSKSLEIFRNQLYPKSISELNSGLFLEERCNYEKLLLWYAILINQNAKIINKYIDLKGKYEREFINGNYANANEYLNIIESEIGFSFWSIDNRLAICEYEEGLEKNKAYLETVITSGCDAWVKFCAEFLSFKAEKSINNRQYIHRIEGVFDEDSKDIASFFREKLLPIQNFEDEEVTDILRLNSKSSIVDMYNTFIKVCIRIISSGDENYIKGIIKAMELITEINDVVITKICWVTSENNKVFIKLSDEDIYFYEISHLYTCGEYRKVISLLNESIEKYSNYFEVYEYYVKSHIMLNQEICLENDISIRNQLILAMYSAYIKSKNVEQSYFTISRFVRLFSNSNFGTELSYFFADKFWVGTYPLLERGKLYSSNIINLRIANLNSSKRDLIFEAFNKIESQNAAKQILEFMAYGKKISNIDSIDEKRIRWYLIKRDIVNNNENAILSLEKWYSELKNDNSIYTIYQKERIVIELYYLYIERNEFIKAETLVVDEKVFNKYSDLRLDLGCIFEKFFVKNKEWKRNICTPIATYLYERDNFTTIFTATANFLRMNGAKKPSELFERVDEFGKARFKFFLKYICKKEVLDSMYTSFDTDEEVENERIDICRYLQVNDKENSSEYIEEISQILQYRKICQGVKYLEDVKIDLDFDRIYESYKEEFHDNYMRYKEIEKLNVDYATYDFTSNVWTVSVGEEQQTYSHTFLAMKELFEDYRQEITFGKFGLDPMLGTRIRHGILQNQIRIAFENNNIIFVSKSTDDRTYVATVTIEKICENLSEEERDTLFLILADFSKKVDDYVDEIVSKKIRIHINEKNSGGVFDFTFAHDFPHVLMSIIREFPNENLAREYFDKLWIRRIEDGLKLARELFDGEVKNTFIEYLKQLGEDISNKIQNARVRTLLLDSISSARTEFQQSISFIIEWFKLPEVKKMENYTAEYLFETCDYINKRVVSNFEDIKIESKITVDGLLKGKTFSYMVDILIILFTNACYHSGYIDKLSELEVKFEMTEVESGLIIQMFNNLNDSVDREELFEIINTIKEKLQECISSGEYYNYEGKSGYIKICKILNYNLECDNSYLEYGLTQDNKKYYIKIEIPKNILTSQEV